MGEYVWTTFTLGGKLSARAVREIAAELAAWFPEEIADAADGEAALRDAASSGRALSVAASINYGNTESLDAACTSHGVAWARHWSAGGDFGSGVTVWRPGMADPVDYDALDNGRPCIGLAELRHAAGEGLDAVQGLIAAVERADAESFPPVEIRGIRPPQAARARTLKGFPKGARVVYSGTLCPGLHGKHGNVTGTKRGWIMVQFDGEPGPTNIAESSLTRVPSPAV